MTLEKIGIWTLDIRHWTLDIGHWIEHWHGLDLLCSHPFCLICQDRGKLGQGSCWVFAKRSTISDNQALLHSCLKWPLGEIYNLIFEHLTYSAILVPNWNTWQKKDSWTHFPTEMIETFWCGKEDASLARNKFLECLDTLELLEKG